MDRSSRELQFEHKNDLVSIFIELVMTFQSLTAAVRELVRTRFINTGSNQVY
jgi:hypothetical protein